MKVAIVELFTENHYGYADAWARVFLQATSDVTVYAPGSFASFVGHPWPCRFVASSPRQRTIDFLLALRREGPFDWVVLTTFEGNYLRYSFFLPPARRWILCLHNANRWLGAEGNRLNPWQRLLRRWTLRRAGILGVTSSQIRQTVRQKFQLTKPTVAVPFGLNNGPVGELTEAPRFCVVVPGMLSATRRRVDRVLAAATELKNIDFVFLGGPSRAEGGREQLDAILSRGLENVVTFDTFVDNETFKTQMRAADLVLSDLNVHFQHPSGPEIYGETKDSGVSFLMIQYEKPGLFNQEFRNLPELAVSTRYFDDTETLVSTLRAWESRGASFQDLKKAAVVAGSLFTSSAVYERELKPLLESQ